MLSIDQCRERLGRDCPLTDQELVRLRDQLYDLARIALDAQTTCPRPEQ